MADDLKMVPCPRCRATKDFCALCMKWSKHARTQWDGQVPEHIAVMYLLGGGFVMDEACANWLTGKRPFPPGLDRLIFAAARKEEERHD